MKRARWKSHVVGLVGLLSAAFFAVGAETQGNATRASPAGVTDAAPRSQVGDGELTLFLAGDTIITQPWSGERAPEFLAIVEEIRKADVAAVNLELVLHDHDAIAQIDSGGGWVGARPEIARELAWAGIDMVATANNHAFDWGSIGVLQNIDHLAEAGLRWAGSGKDLLSARAPAYRGHPDGSVALVATSATFTPYGRASNARPEVRGRPGINPLTTTAGGYIEVPPAIAGMLWNTAKALGIRRHRYDENWLSVSSQTIHQGGRIGFHRGRWVDPTDLAANLAAVRKAAESADLVVFSIHAHRQGRWLTELAHQAIEAGANVVFAHGPHEILGAEIYAGAPIFYGLGDFVFQIHRTERFPSESYEKFRLKDDATPEDVRNAFMRRDPLWKEREPWESVAAIVRFKNGALQSVRLLPMDLGFGAPPAVRGIPRRAGRDTGRRIIGSLADRSRPYGTVVRYLEAENAGQIEFAPKVGSELSPQAAR